METLELTKLTNSALHHTAVSLAKDERQKSIQVIQILREVGRRSMHLEMGYRSLHDYAERALGYSHTAAHRRVSAAQVIESLPKAEQDKTIQALESAKTNLTTLVAAKSFFYQEKKSQITYTPTQRAEVIKKLESKSHYEVQKTLVAQSKSELTANQLTPKTEIKPIRGGKVRFEFMADESLKNKLDQIKNLIAHRNPNPTMEELLEIMTDIVLKKIDPTRRAPKSREVADISLSNLLISNLGICENSAAAAPSVKLPTKTRSYKKADIYALWTRAQSRCEFISPKGQRCTSHYGLEVEHSKPFSRGGTNDLSNLKLFCRTHNTYAWKSWKAGEQNTFTLS